MNGFLRLNIYYLKPPHRCACAEICCVSASFINPSEVPPGCSGKVIKGQCCDFQCVLVRYYRTIPCEALHPKHFHITAEVY